MENNDLTNPEISEQFNIIIFPEYAKLKTELEKLRTELSMLLLEHDTLIYVECKNIEMSYMLSIGHLEYKIYELECEILRQKRKIELIQIKKNRQESISLSAIEKTLNQEFASYQKKLNEQMNKINAALERSHSKTLDDDSAKELKKLYRTIVKSLHPDLNPNISKEKIALFQNAVKAYENGDLDGMRIINEIISKSDISDVSEESMTELAKEKERLLNNIYSLQDMISKIKQRFPYNMLDMLQDSTKVEQKIAELKAKIDQYNEILTHYKRTVSDMLGD